MTSPASWRTASAVAAMLYVSAAGLSAQASAPATRTNSGRGVDVSLDAFGGWDVDLSSPQVDPDTGAELTRDTGGQYAGVNASLGLRRGTENVSFAANLDTSFRSYAEFGRDVVPGYVGAVRLGSTGESRRIWTLSQSVSYAPVNTLSFFAGATAPLPIGAATSGAPVVDYQISPIKQFVSESAGSFGYRLSRRSSLQFSGTYSIVETPDETDMSLLRRWSASGRYTQQTSRYSSLYGGYTYAQGQSPSQGDGVTAAPTIQSIDVGVGYARPLSFSRDTTVSFQTGTTAVDDGTQGRQYQFVGSGAVQHQLGRSWNVGGSFERSVRFVPAFADPMLTNGFTVQAGGQLNARSSLRLFTNLARGSVGSTTGANNVESSSVSVQYRLALRERFGFYAEYFYFESALGDAVVVPGGVPGDQRRNGVRVGVTLGTTLLGVRR